MPLKVRAATQANALRGMPGIFFFIFGERVCHSPKMPAAPRPQALFDVAYRQVFPSRDGVLGESSSPLFFLFRGS